MTLMYDGHDFESLFIVGDPEISILNYQPKTVESDSKNGSAVIGKTWGNSTVAFTLVVEGSASERRDKLSTLGAWLDVDEPKPLVLPDNPDRYYMAVPSGALELNRAIGAEYAQITFLITEPDSYGKERTVTVPSGGSITFIVGGTAKTYPRITASAVRDSSSQVWGIKLDEGDYVHIATGAAAARAIVADCENRTLTIAGAVAIPTPDSDWLELEPGEHTLRMDNGTGAATVTFIERWK